MTFDVACGGAIYLDLTFVGLASVPRPGEEHWADDLVFSPGGMANTAIGLARLGLRVVMVSPLGSDFAGRYLRTTLEAEGITCSGPASARSAICAVLPMHGDRALVSYAPADADLSDGLRRVSARAVVVLVDHQACAPPGVPAYVLTSHAQVHAARLGSPTPLARAHAIVTNASEAVALTADPDAPTAARRLARTFDTAVVTLGGSGTLAATDDVLVEAPAPPVEVRDTTGAGDLFTAGYIWADLQGRGLEARLQWANLYAALSLRTVTAYAGAATRAELEHAARERWLTT